MDAAMRYRQAGAVAPVGTTLIMFALWQRPVPVSTGSGDRTRRTTRRAARTADQQSTQAHGRLAWWFTQTAYPTVATQAVEIHGGLPWIGEAVLVHATHPIAG